MVGTIFAIVVLLVGFIGAGFIRDYDGKPIKGVRLGVRVGAVILATVLILFACGTQVRTGHTGIPVKFGQVQDYTMDSGLNWHSPFINVVEMDNREQRYHFELLALY